MKEETESRRVRAREKSVSRPRGLRLRPKSPSYPPPGHLHIEFQSGRKARGRGSRVECRVVALFQSRGR